MEINFVEQNAFKKNRIEYEIPEFISRNKVKFTL